MRMGRLPLVGWPKLGEVAASRFASDQMSGGEG
jgi:hypothetical protein